jgi:hypothetical protein
MKTPRRGSILLFVAALTATTAAARTAPTTPEAPVPPTPTTVPETPQSVLGPGMYVFQTRTRSATCGDDEVNGYVDSFVAPIHGVPSSRRMTMSLVDTRWWSTWTITVDGEDRIYGDSLLDGGSGPNRPTHHFVVSRRDAARLTGVGVRTYPSTVAGAARTCQVFYDALLRRIDL